MGWLVIPMGKCSHPWGVSSVCRQNFKLNCEQRKMTDNQNINEELKKVDTDIDDNVSNLLECT